MLVLVGVTLLLAILLAIAPQLFGFVDPVDLGLRVENRTDRTIVVVAPPPPGGTEDVVYARIAPHTSARTGLDCASILLIARTEDGEEIARRGPFDDCNQKDWVIEPPS
jgi:hypothetical protein